MPIVGLTDQTATGAGLPTIAKLYKGSEKETRNRNGQEYQTVGKDLDYFRVEFEPQFAHLESIWKELYGNEPTEFSPMFLTAQTVDEAFSSWKEEWNSSGTLLHRCDGQHQVMWWNESAQMYGKAKIMCASPINPQTGAIDNPKCNCKATGRLSVILPEFVTASGVLGYISISTHSTNDILTVYRYLSDIQRIYGRLDGVPFIFGRAAKEVSAPKQVKKGNGQYVTEGRIKVKKSLFYLHVEPDFMRERMLLPMTTSAPALPPVVSSDTGEIISTDQAKSLLGSGGGTRRLGAPEPVETPSPDDTNWIDDKGQRERFLAWALERYNYIETHVLAAFGTVMGERLESLTDWTGSDTEAMAAVIAQYYDYDAGQIKHACRSFKTKDVEIYALEIAKEVLERGAQPEIPI